MSRRTEMTKVTALPRSVAVRIAREIAATTLDVSARMILGPSRRWEVSEARRKSFLVATHLHPRASFVSIGRAFNKDHTTVLHALERTKASRERAAARLLAIQATKERSQ